MNLSGGTSDREKKKKKKRYCVYRIFRVNNWNEVNESRIFLTIISAFVYTAPTITGAECSVGMFDIRLYPIRKGLLDRTSIF